MRKMSMIVLAALCLLWPMTGAAQGLPAFLDAVEDGLATGLSTGAVQAASAMDQELTLEIGAEDGRIEEGEALTVTLTAGNPRPVDTAVTLTLKLPDRLEAADGTTWEAVLPAAQVDEQTGELVPSVSTFAREVTLKPGGASETVSLESEMSMGTRFYRASVPLELCVADVRAATPSNAAELAVPDRRELAGQLERQAVRMRRAMTARLEEERGRLERCAASRVLTDPLASLRDKRVLLDWQQSRLASRMQSELQTRRGALAALAASLDALSPLKVLGRGYALARDEGGHVVSSVSQVRAGQPISLRLADGTLDCTVMGLQKTGQTARNRPK